jgi:signal transduction histidine kinase
MAPLAAYLFSRREAILANWRTACENDPTLSTVSTLSREEFNNLIPILLNILDQRLLGQPQEADAGITAHAHGLHRWHKAHGLQELLRELGHLSRILVAELQRFRQLYPDHDPDGVAHSFEQVNQLMSEMIDGSAAKYDELQRLEATRRATSLQYSLDQMQELSRQRGDILRTSSHDLKGGFGIINSAAYLLKMEGLTEAERDHYVDMLNRNLTNVQDMLEGLMNLARLEAGQEVVTMGVVDVGQLLTDLVTSAQPVATERGLKLLADGPASFRVQTDGVILYRIAQNLLHNALRYSSSGVVSICWSRETDYRWTFSVQDSGPGLPPGLVTLFASQLKPTVEPTAVMGNDQAEPNGVIPKDEPIELPLSITPVRGEGQGEGVGLHIVKRLCELLDANLDIESRSGRGTLFRIRLSTPTINEQVSYKGAD